MNKKNIDVTKMFRRCCVGLIAVGVILFSTAKYFV